MTTATDWDVRDSDTGSHAVVTSVTTAPTDTPFTPSVPPAVEFYREPTREEVKAETAPVRDLTSMRMPLRLDRADARAEYGRLRATYDAERQHAQDWRDLAFDAEKAKTNSTPRHRDVVTPLMQAYERERDALIHGLRSGAPSVAGQVYDAEQGWIDADTPQRRTDRDVTLGDYIAAEVEVAEREAKAAMSSDTAKLLAPTEVGASEPTSKSEAAELEVPLAAQPEPNYDDTELPRQVGTALGLTLGFFLAFMGVAWIAGAF